MFELLEATVETIREALSQGEMTSYELVKQYLLRIAQLDKSGPALNSIIEVNPDAIYIAQAMDRERANGTVRGPLHGIPILLKDSFNTQDKLHTSAGALALADNYATYDATVVRKLREAGLVILGKTNMTEMANFMAYEMKNGYSSRGGQVINPYNPEGDPWGSSSGSAVAMAANLATLSLGTETNGSIIGPAHNNSIVGIKPTRGLISRHGIIPICTAQDTAGPMTRTVADAAALLNILVGYDEHDPSTWAQAENIPDDYTDYLNRNGLQNKRVGFNIGYQDEWTPDQVAMAKQVRAAFESAGATVIDVDLPHQRNDFNILLHEFKQCLNHYLSTCSPSNQCQSLKDIIEYNQAHPEKCLKYGQGILLDAEALSGTLTEPQYITERFEALQKTGPDGISKLIQEHKLDAIISPGISDASPISGYPSIVVPVGYDSDNIPFGLSIVGEPFSEPVLIEIGYAFEQLSQARKLPPIEQ